MGKVIVTRTPRKVATIPDATELVGALEFVKTATTELFQKYNPDEQVLAVHVNHEDLYGVMTNTTPTTSGSVQVGIAVLTDRRKVDLSIPFAISKFAKNTVGFYTMNNIRGEVISNLFSEVTDISAFIEDALTTVQFPGTKSIRSRVEVANFGDEVLAPLAAKGGNYKEAWQHLLDSYISCTPSHLAALEGLEVVQTSLVDVISGLANPE